MKNLKTVLVVEDEPLIAMSIEQVVEEAGLSAVSTHSIADALTQLSSGSFDLAILDYAIRRESSEPVAKALRSKGIPFIVCTGSQLSNTVEAFAGAPYLSKPYSDQELQNAVLSLTRH